MMTEPTETPAGVEYSEVYIGDCAAGCTRPATARIYKDWVVCALHYQEYKVTERINEASLALEILEPWRSEAEFHGCLHLLAGLDRIAEDERGRLNGAKEDRAALDRIDHESAPNHDVREAMGKKIREEREREKGGTIGSDDG